MSTRRIAMSVRMPPELHAAILARAEAEGLTPAEIIRNVVHQWAYGEMPSASEGYAQARGLALRIAQDALRRAIETLPLDPEVIPEYVRELTERDVAVRRHGGR